MGFGRRLMLATPNRTALILGYGMVALTRALITFGVVTAIAVIAGMEIGGSAAELAAMYGLAAIVNVAGVLFAAGVALRFRSLQATPLMQVPVFLFLFLAPVYVPRELLTGWVEAVSGFDPATHIMETGRELLAGQPADVLGALAIAVGPGRSDGRVRGARAAQGRGRGIVTPRTDPQRIVDLIANQMYFETRPEALADGRPPARYRRVGAPAGADRDRLAQQRAVTRDPAVGAVQQAGRALCQPGEPLPTGQRRQQRRDRRAA